MRCNWYWYCRLVEVFGLPMGVSALTLLIIAAIATYVRVVSVNISLITDWLSFIPALICKEYNCLTMEDAYMSFRLYKASIEIIIDIE